MSSLAEADFDVVGPTAVSDYMGLPWTRNAFQWTATEGMLALADFDPTRPSAENEVSADGSTIEPKASLLFLGLEVGDSSELSAVGISNERLTLSCQGRNPRGRRDSGGALIAGHRQPSVRSHPRSGSRQAAPSGAEATHGADVAAGIEEAFMSGSLSHAASASSDSSRDAPAPFPSGPKGSNRRTSAGMKRKSAIRAVTRALASRIP